MLEQAEGVLKVEAAQERLPQSVHVGWCGAGAGRPYPHWLRVLIAGQVVHHEPDQGAFQDGQGTVVVDPCGAAGQSGGRSHAWVTAVP